MVVVVLPVQVALEVSSMHLPYLDHLPAMLKYSKGALQDFKKVHLFYTSVLPHCMSQQRPYTGEMTGFAIDWYAPVLPFD